MCFVFFSHKGTKTAKKGRATASRLAARAGSPIIATSLRGLRSRTKQSSRNLATVLQDCFVATFRKVTYD